ncbi:MAG: EscU/YscU/HrcU family type III secretion system export apparatus switch protein, partial [Planctomycetota bacterium]
MPEQSAGEKSEDPTPRKLTEARNDGNVAKSTDLAAAATLLAAIAASALFAERFVMEIGEMLRSLMTDAFAGNPTRADDLVELGAFSSLMLARIVGPLALVVFVVTGLVMLMQVGFLLTTKPITPKPERLNPIKGIANLFNLRAAMRFVMSLSKISIIAVVAVVMIALDLPEIVGIVELEAIQGLVAMAWLMFVLAVKLALVLLILALLDYAYQRYQRWEDLKMTKQDVKDEMKRMDGDPMVRQRRAQVARQLAMQRLSAAVPTADVVVTNPTHYAVALRYDAGSMGAPRVVAKGVDLLAVRVRQLAAQHGVPIVERPPLARAL